MTEDIQKYSLFIKNSKFFFGRILKRDSKTRNVELELNNQKKTICKIKDLILEVSLANSPVTNNIELSNLWSDLSNKTQIISTNEFIKIAKPKILISFLDNYNSFYLIKKTKEQKKILLQNASRTNEGSTFKLKKSYKKNRVDYLFCHNFEIKKK